MAKYSFSKSKVVDGNGAVETFQASEFASFDEAIKAVDKGWYDRDLEMKEARKPKDQPLAAGFGKDQVQSLSNPVNVRNVAPVNDMDNNVGNNQN